MKLVKSVESFSHYSKCIEKSTYAKVHGWMHCRDKKQENHLAVKCTTFRSKLLKFIFRKNNNVTFW